MPVAHYSLEGTTALIKMDDGKANALSDAMITEVGEALARAEKEATAVVLAGRPERFCAGFDLKVMMSSPDAAVGLLRSGAGLLMRLYGSPLPIVAACTGHALAGGALVLLTADVRFGADGPFRIGLNEVSIGMPVPVLAMELARDRITTTELGRATLRAHIYGPEEATRVGFLDDVVPDGGSPRAREGRGGEARRALADGVPRDEAAHAWSLDRAHPRDARRGHDLDHPRHARRVTRVRARA